MATSTVCALFVLVLCLPSGLIDCDLGQRVSSSVEALAPLSAGASQVSSRFDRCRSSRVFQHRIKYQLRISNPKLDSVSMKPEHRNERTDDVA